MGIACGDNVSCFDLHRMQVRLTPSPLYRSGIRIRFLQNKVKVYHFRHAEQKYVPCTGSSVPKVYFP